jgi:hypothetical protein
VFGNYGFKKKTVLVTFEPPCDSVALIFDANEATQFEMPDKLRTGV